MQEVYGHDSHCRLFGSSCTTALLLSSLLLHFARGAGPFPLAATEMAASVEASFPRAPIQASVRSGTGAYSPSAAKRTAGVSPKPAVASPHRAKPKSESLVSA